jgi:fructose-bisphosphate aldolase class II
MTSYKELGLVNTRDMFAKAVKGGYAIPAYNFNNMEQLQAIIQACVAEKSHYTQPSEVIDFVSKTGVDSLAISIGTSHGANKFTPAQCTRNAEGILIPPPLRFDILAEIEEQLPGFPIVLHGSSSVPQEYVKMINEHGGHLKDSVGIPEDQLRQAAKSAVCKINIDSDGRLAMTGTIRKVFDEHPDWFDPRKYLGPARDALKEMYMHKNKDVLGSAGQA